MDQIQFGWIRSRSIPKEFDPESLATFPGCSKLEQPFSFVVGDPTLIRLVRQLGSHSRLFEPFGTRQAPLGLGHVESPVEDQPSRSRSTAPANSGRASMRRQRVGSCTSR